MTYGADFTNLGSIQARTINYNADNMPTQISHSSNITTQLTYGGTGERVKKRVYSGGNVTDTYYIGDHFEVKGGVVTKFIFAGNLRIAQVKGTTRSFFHKDHLGSSTVMTNNSGGEIESTEYMPFGSQRSHSGTNTSDYKYTDQELDSENGLYNYNARLYDPFIGRFISPDTIVPSPYNPQSLNRYTYCLNNPLIYVDPSGHQETEYDDEWNTYRAKLEYIFWYGLYTGSIPNNLASTGFELWAFTMGLDPMNLNYNHYRSYKTQIEYLELMTTVQKFSRADDVFHWSKDRGACWARAGLMGYYLIAAGYKVDFVVTKPASPPPNFQYWEYHIAPRVQLSDGKSYVIDPTFNSAAPIEIDSWMSSLGYAPGTLPGRMDKTINAPSSAQGTFDWTDLPPKYPAWLRISYTYNSEPEYYLKYLYYFNLGPDKDTIHP